MGTWAAFYVKTPDQLKLVEAIRSAIPGITDVAQDQPGSLTNDITPSTNGDPDRLILSQTNPEWVTVFQNSFDDLGDLCTDLSRDLETSIIVTMAQTTSDYYYFALYDNGVNKREIEACYSDDSESINSGERFPFENAEPGEKVEYDEEESYLFDFESLEKYCKQFGFDMYVDPENSKWTLLQAHGYRSIVKNKGSNKKPWWKLW